MIVLGVGDYGSTRQAGEAIKTIGLGSCIAVIMLDPATHELFQELATLVADRREFGAVGASEAAIGRAAVAWLEAKVARAVEPVGGVA